MAPGLTVNAPSLLREPDLPAASQVSGSPPSASAEPSPPEPSRIEDATKAFTLDFGPFVTDADAEAIEKRLNQLGASTVRYRRRSGSALYTVKVAELQTQAEARAAMEQLKARHPTLRPRTPESETEGRIRIVLEPRLPLREAVALATQLRSEGFAVRIDSSRGTAPLFALRLASAYDLKTAREKSEEFRNHGLPNAVVPVEPSSSSVD